MEKIAFRMFLKPGQAERYRERHDALWPELADLLKSSGVSDYSIYLDENSFVDGYQVLFAVLRRSPAHRMESLSQHPVMQRWWTHMAELMRTNPDGSPVVEFLPCVFHLD